MAADAGVGKRHSHLGEDGAAKRQKPAMERFLDPAKVADLEHSYNLPEVVSQRASFMRILALRAGDRVLDVGCGTGLLLKELAVAVGPGGAAIGVEISAAMRLAAEHKLEGVPAVEVLAGDAARLPVGDASCDVVVYSQVLLYVPDVLGALKEAKRVLRPGGKIAILDTDWAGLVVRTDQPDVLRRLLASHEKQFHDAHLPPKIPAHMSDAGLELQSVETIAMLGQGRVDNKTSWLVKSAVDNMVKPAHGAPDADRAAWAEEQGRLCDAGQFFACLHRYVFLGRKPT